MNRLLIITFMIALIMACRPEPSKQPYRLPDEQLARLYLDIQLGEISLTGLDAAKKDSLTSMFSQRLSHIYGLSAEDIEAEIRHLETDPEKMKWVLERAGALADSIQ